VSADLETEQIFQNVDEIAKEIKIIGPETSAMVWGSPGIGKTESLEDTFKDHTIDLVLAGCSEPTDIGGVPNPHIYNGIPVATDVLPPLWAWKASVDAPKEFWGDRVIFCDDIPTGHEQTQAACFKMFGERKVGNLKLRDNVYVIGAGNRVDHKSGAYEMPLALGNRMKHYHAISNVPVWVAWALKNGIHPVVLAYIRTRTDALDQFAEHIKTGHEDNAFATPRTWAMLSRAMFRMDSKGTIGPWLDSVAMGCVGRVASAAFVVFARTSTNLVPPEQIVNDPYNARIPGSHEPDVLHATISSLEHYINQKQNYKHWINAVRYVLRDGVEPEYGILVAKMAITIAFNKIGPEERAKAIATPEFIKLTEAFGVGLATSEEPEDKS